LCINNVGAQGKATARLHARGGLRMMGKSFKEPGPFQHLLGVLEQIHNSLVELALL
jgi:hypothetical protein